MFKSNWIAPSELWDNIHIEFSKSFTLNSFDRVKIRITADDYYKLYVNGKYIGQGPAPSYSICYRYNEYDITDALVNGHNEITALVYYQGLNNRVWLSGDARIGMIADIFDSGNYLFGTDKSWQYHIDNTFIESDTVGYDTAFLENRDMTVPKSRYKNSSEVLHDYTFDAEPFPALSVYEVKKQPKITGNTYFYDFEQEYVCNISIAAHSKADGTRLIIRCAEELNEDNTLRFDMRCGCNYEEYCILKKGENIIEQYDYKALRYLEIEADSEIEVKEAKLLVRHFPFPEYSQEIFTDSKELKAVFKLCKNTVKYGAQEVFIDCPTREKGQYIGDVLISGFAHFYLTNDCRLLKKALFDFSDSVRFSGELLAVAPCSYKQSIADYALIYPYMVLKYYELTEDKETLGKLFSACNFVVDCFSKYENSQGLLCDVECGWNLVDWPENMRDDYEIGSLHNVINAYYYLALTSVERIKTLLGIAFKNKSEGVKIAFNNAFYNTDTGLYTDIAEGVHSSVHSNILPIVFGICSDDSKQRLIDFLIKKGMACSVYMSYFYLKALCLADKKEEALSFITSKGENSWLNMIKEGATTAFEAWGKERKWNTSLFHPWACSPILIINEHFPKLLKSSF